MCGPCGCADARSEILISIAFIRQDTRAQWFLLPTYLGPWYRPFKDCGYKFKLDATSQAGSFSFKWRAHCPKAPELISVVLQTRAEYMPFNRIACMGSMTEYVLGRFENASNYQFADIYIDCRPCNTISFAKFWPLIPMFFLCWTTWRNAWLSDRPHWSKSWLCVSSHLCVLFPLSSDQ